MLHRTLVCCVLSSALLPGLRAANVPPSKDPPGGLPPEQVPQFILITHDDDVAEETTKTIAKFTHKNRNGCPVKMTFYVAMQVDSCDQGRQCDTSPVVTCDNEEWHKGQYWDNLEGPNPACLTRCPTVRGLMLAGHEIATHTFGHASARLGEPASDAAWDRQKVDPSYQKLQVTGHGLRVLCKRACSLHFSLSSCSLHFP